MKIAVKSVQCPICGAQETENGKLLIRAFKVHRDNAWWSQCISERDHGGFTAVYEDSYEKEIDFPEKPWFVVNDDDSFSIEVGAKDYFFNGK